MLGFGMILSILMLLFSAQTMLAAQQAAQVFVQSVMPSLFPMMIVGHLITSCMPFIASRTGLCIFQIMFGFCAGSPASTRQLTALAERQRLSLAIYRSLLCMSGVMSPMFFTGALASRMSKQAAWLMLCSHWAGALLTGLLYAGLHKACNHHSPMMTVQNAASTATIAGQRPAQPTKSASSASIAAVLPSAISSTALALLSVLGAMMTFSILAAVFRAVLAQLFPQWTATHGAWLALGWSLMEISGGAMALLDCLPAAPPWLVCALCSFGGLSIWLQNLLFLSAKIHPAELLGFRALHGVLAGICCFVVSSWIGGAGMAASTASLMPDAAPLTASSGLTLWLPLLLLVILAVHPRLHRPSA